MPDFLKSLVNFLVEIGLMLHDIIFECLSEKQFDLLQFNLAQIKSYFLLLKLDLGSIFL